MQRSKKSIRWKVYDMVFLYSFCPTRIYKTRNLLLFTRHWKDAHDLNASKVAETLLQIPERFAVPRWPKNHICIAFSHYIYVCIRVMIQMRWRWNKVARARSDIYGLLAAYGFCSTKHTRIESLLCANVSYNRVVFETAVPCEYAMAGLSYCGFAT